jgi:glycosyltransferase involved in cell wall biosynthesis
MTRRVLMVAFHFPPSGAVAAQRPSKFARYLPDAGWSPSVLARVPDPQQPLDDSFAGQPGAWRCLSPFEPATLLGVLPASWSAALRRRLFLPDEERGWRAMLARELPRYLDEVEPDVLWANSVPVGSLVVAARAARAAGRPFVADFHNEWTRNMYYRPPTARHDRAHRALEEEVVTSARAVVTLNPLHTEDLRARFPGVRVETIENGFDPSDYEVAPPDPSRRPFVFVYGGAVYGHQSPEPFLRALAETGIRDVEVRVVGDRFGAFQPGAWPFPVSVRGNLPHRHLGRTLSEASAFFLCLEPPAARQLPAKLYEYLRAGRPTFAIAPRGGAVDRWLAERKAGVCADAAAPTSWAPALRAFIDALPAYRPVPAPDLERSAQALRLGALLDEAAR